MYFSKMNEEQFMNFLKKLDYRHVFEVQDIFIDYGKKYNNEKAINLGNLANEYRQSIIDQYDENDPGPLCLDLYEIKWFLERITILQLCDMNFLLRGLKDESIRYHYIYEVSKMVYHNRFKYVMNKSINDMTIDEVEFYLNNISTNSLEMYCIDAGGKSLIITPVEFYEYYHDKEINNLVKKYKEDVINARQ